MKRRALVVLVRGGGEEEHERHSLCMLTKKRAVVRLVPAVDDVLEVALVVALLCEDVLIFFSFSTSFVVFERSQACGLLHYICKLVSDRDIFYLQPVVMRIGSWNEKGPV